MVLSVSKENHQTFADFENLELKFNDAISSNEYAKLVELFDQSKKIYVVANGMLALCWQPYGF